MLIIISGPDSFLAHSAINKLKAKYLEKNPDGAELIEIDETTTEPSWADLLAVPLFATSRLIIIRRLGYFSANAQQQLATVLAQVPDSTVVVAWDAREIKDQSLQQQLATASKKISATTPRGASLVRWLVNRAKELGFELEASQLQQLEQRSCNELWELETELKLLATGASSEPYREASSEPFIFFNQVRRGDWTALKKELAKKVRLGEPIELLIGSLAAALRKESKDSSQAKNLAELLLDIDLGLKTGALDPDSAVALIIAHLPQPLANRVQWEHSWEEIAS